MGFTEGDPMELEMIIGIGGLMLTRLVLPIQLFFVFLYFFASSDFNDHVI